MLRPQPIMFLAFVLWLLAMTATAQEEITDPYADVPRTRTEDGGFILGEPDAPVKLIEFSDFLCASCQNYEPIISGFIEDFVLTGQAQFEYRIFPVIDPELSVLSANLVECADTLRAGQFWLAHDLMFDIVSDRGFTDETIAEFAEALELDPQALSQCAAGAMQHSIDSAYGLSLGVSGTPTLFVQYEESKPIPIALALPEHYPAIAKAIRPASSESVTITLGDYAGLTTYRSADGGFVLGEQDAPLTIVAFEDFLCPHCQSYVATLKEFVDAYVRTGKAQLEFRLYPLVNPEHSTTFAKVAECVAVQDLGQFWDAHDLLFQFAGTGNVGDIATKVASLLSLDAEALAACLDRSMQFLIDVYAGQSAGVSGTPAIRARDNEGNLQVIYSGQQPQDRGGLSLDLLSALADAAPGVSIGVPERSLLNDNFLDDTSLITGEPCAPPCWQNITPGETSMAEALSAVGDMTGIADPHVAADRFQFGLTNAPVCCQVSSGDGATVHTILLQFAPAMQFGDAVSALGEPLFYDGLPFSDSETMMVFYFSEPSLLITAVVPGIDGALQASSPIVGAIYSTQETLSSALEATTLVPWQGYVSFADYMDAKDN